MNKKLSFIICSSVITEIVYVSIPIIKIGNVFLHRSMFVVLVEIFARIGSWLHFTRLHLLLGSASD